MSAGRGVGETRKMVKEICQGGSMSKKSVVDSCGDFRCFAGGGFCFEESGCD